MKIYALWQSRRTLAVISTAAVLAGCVTTSTVENPYQNANGDNAQSVKVSRDSKLRDNDTIEKQNCPTIFYINDTAVGQFFVKDRAEYHLPPAKYLFTVKNCKGNSAAHALNVNISSAPHSSEYVLTLDGHGRPFIVEKPISAGRPNR